jgi:hypothetical protein
MIMKGCRELHFHSDYPVKTRQRRRTRSPGWFQAKTPLLWSANSTWIAVVLFAASFGVMALTFHSAGIVMDPQAGPTAHAPAGVIGVVGVTDKLTVAVNYLWVAAVAWQAIRLSREETR